MTRPGAFADSLRVAIDRWGWTQHDAARAFGVTDATVSRWLSGRRAPQTATATRILAVLGVSLEELLEMGKETG